MIKEVVRKFLFIGSYCTGLMFKIFLNKLSKDLKLGQELLWACFLCTLSTIIVHVTVTIKIN